MRGAHPIRSGQTIPRRIKCQDFSRRPSESYICCANSSRCEKMAAQACASESSAYLVRMVEAATVPMLGGRNGAANREDVEGSLGGADVGFLVLSLVSDTLKCLRKRSCLGDPSSFVRCKRKRDGDARGPRDGLGLEANFK
ncbi:unnamed protein product [Ectocarpus fasciculatus]